MNFSFTKLFLFFLLFFSWLNGQDTGGVSTVDTLFIDSTGKGSFTIDYNENVKSLLKKSISETCVKKSVIKNTKVIITDSDIKKVHSADKCIITPKIMGYKIQVFYTKDRLKAEKIKEEFSSKFPNLTSEVKYLQPDFKVLIGDYLSKNSAASDFSKIKRQYSSSFLIQFPVRCRIAH